MNMRRILPGNIHVREPYPLEIEFFRFRRDVSGYAADDGMVVLNPFSELTEEQLAAVALNEAARIYMKRHSMQPSFDLTDEQAIAFATYGPEECQKATIAARLLSGDPTALLPSDDQRAFVSRLALAMGLVWPRVSPREVSDIDGASN